MASKMENRVGVKFAVFRSNPWHQFIVLLESCCKNTIHENVENKISDFLLHKAHKDLFHLKFMISTMTLILI